jgi:O-antigen ligase
MSPAWGAGIAFAALALFSLVFFYVFLGWLSWELISALAIGTGLVAMVSATIASRRSTVLGRRNMTLVIWAFLLCSENFFIRWGTNEDAFSGALSLSAYAEAATWVLVMLVLLIPAFTMAGGIGNLFSGQYKWMTMFAGVSAVTAAFSPKPAFSLAWAFKLCLVVLALRVISTHLQSLDDTKAFLRANLIAFVFLAFEPMVLAFSDPANTFDDGRLGGDISTTHIAAMGASVALLALTLFSHSRHKWVLLLAAIAGLGIVVIAGGKTAFVAAVLGGLLYFSLQGKAGIAVAYVTGLGALAMIGISFTPLAGYVRGYLDAGGASSLTGRTDLWEMAMPFIWSKPILGHGFISSKFFAVQVSGLGWVPGHMHNWALEILYNSGIIGLAVFLPILYYIVRNLVFVLRSSDTSQPIFQLAAGCLGLFAMLFVDGLLEASFGGKPGSSFMLLLAVAVASERLAAVQKASLPE